MNTTEPARIFDLEEERLYSGWSRLSAWRFHYRRRDGAVQSLRYEIADHGSGAAVLLFDPARETVALVRQFRLPAKLNGDPELMIEVCAGLLDGDDPETCARRETLEECGIAITALTPAFVLYASPGALTEKIHCFVGTYDANAPRDPGTAQQDPDEDVETLEIPLRDAIAAIAQGTITDAKTVALLQHLWIARLTGEMC